MGVSIWEGGKAERAAAALESLAEHFESYSGMIAPDYSTLTFPVSAGQLCIHDGGLYSANQVISTSEDWTAAHWDRSTVGEEIENINALGLSVSNGKICITYEEVNE